MRRNRQRRFAAAACFLLAALLLLLALSLQIRLRAVQDELRELENEREALARERGILTVRVNERLSLSELDRRAEEELGMRPCRGNQIAEIGIEEETDAYR
ncbi:MAG: hypothetical protein IJP64_01805 [Oscillospiraceae bacterium]|nr:hypothetical protein [Oscillospiraceae bacterium]